MNKQIIITLLQTGSQDLANTIRSVPEDKLQWKPLDNGRTILDLFGEATQTAKFAAEFTRTRGETQMSADLFRSWIPLRADWTREYALEQLEANTSELIAVVEELSDEDLAQNLKMTLHDAEPMPIAAWIMMAYRAFVSRYAQINYIQTLYGDFDFH